MKRNIKKEMVMARKLAIIVIATGILFALIACILFFKKDILQVFPRMDIAWVGFLVVAILLCVSGIWVFSISGKKQDWINETDERESLITAKANMVGYVIQTTLLGIVFFLLVFYGLFKQSFWVFYNWSCFDKWYRIMDLSFIFTKSRIDN